MMLHKINYVIVIINLCEEDWVGCLDRAPIPTLSYVEGAGRGTQNNPRAAPAAQGEPQLSARVGLSITIVSPKPVIGTQESVVVLPTTIFNI